MDMVVLVFLSMICAVCDRRIDVCLYSLLYPLLALSGLFDFSIQLLESSDSEKTGTGLVCSQTVLTGKAEL